MSDESCRSGDEHRAILRHRINFVIWLVAPICATALLAVQRCSGIAKLVLYGLAVGERERRSDASLLARSGQSG